MRAFLLELRIIRSTCLCLSSYTADEMASLLPLECKQQNRSWFSFPSESVGWDVEATEIIQPVEIDVCYVSFSLDDSISGKISTRLLFPRFCFLTEHSHAQNRWPWGSQLGQQQSQKGLPAFLISLKFLELKNISSTYFPPLFLNIEEPVQERWNDLLKVIRAYNALDSISQIQVLYEPLSK